MKNTSRTQKTIRYHYSSSPKINQLQSEMYLTCRAEALEIHVGSKHGVLFNASYDVSFAFPQSTTKTTSFIVILVSAIFVARTIFRTPSGGLSKINLCMGNKNTKVLESINYDNLYTHVLWMRIRVCR